MLRDAADFLGTRIRQRAEHIPLGYSWIFAVTVDVTMAAILVVATLQRPVADLPACLLAFAIALVPDLAFLFTRIDFRPWFMWVTSMAAAAVLLFATATPIAADFTPLLLVLMISATVAMSPPLPGVLAALSAAALLVAAAQAHRLDELALYLPVLGMGWLVGFLMQVQRRLMIKQEEAQAALAEHAVADERRRIAREVHDVVAHSLSVTMLHVTGARRALQEDRDIDDAVDALEDAERLGRQAMASIRRTVGLLDDAPLRTAPEPDADDITGRVRDFVRAGLAVRLQVDGPTQRLSATEGLALYRIVQESLANIAKHAPESESTVTLRITLTTAELAVVNRLPVPAGGGVPGRGLTGMRQRVELLGGTVDIGPAESDWVVRASIPLSDSSAGRAPRCRG